MITSLYTNIHHISYALVSNGTGSELFWRDRKCLWKISTFSWKIQPMLQQLENSSVSYESMSHFTRNMRAYTNNFLFEKSSIFLPIHLAMVLLCLPPSPWLILIIFSQVQLIHVHMGKKQSIYPSLSSSKALLWSAFPREYYGWRRSFWQIILTDVLRMCWAKGPRSNRVFLPGEVWYQPQQTWSISQVITTFAVGIWKKEEEEFHSSLCILLSFEILLTT